MRDVGEIPDFGNWWESREYTDEEVRRLRGRWETKDIFEVAAWIHAGTPRENKGIPVPKCIRTSQRAGPGAFVFDMRGIDLRGCLAEPRDERSPKIESQIRSGIGRVYDEHRRAKEREEEKRLDKAAKGKNGKRRPSEA